VIASFQRLLSSWRVEQRVVAALLMREVMTRFGRHNLGFLWLFVEPMIFTLGVTALWTATRSLHGSTLPIVPFAVTGYSSVLLWRNMPARLIDAVEPNRTLLYHRNVKVIDIYLARLLLEASGATISFMTLTLFFWSLGWMHGPEDVLKIMEAWLLLALFGGGLAIFLGSMSEEFEIIEKLWHPFSYLFFPLSGAAYLVSSLPQSVQPLALYLPMVNGVEMLREGYFGSEMTAIYDLPYFICVTLVVWLLALLELRKISKRAIAA
jgi:ABC-2 type transport system permease protein/capsular polysaccharide transport system permease protein